MVLDTPGISTGPVSPGAMSFAKKGEQRREAEAHETIQRILKAFEQTVQEARIEYRTIEVTGDPAEEILKESTFYDLVIIGLRTFFKFENSVNPDDTLSKLMGHMPPPVLAVPETFIPFRTDLNVVIAYGGGRPAARSIRAFSQMAAFSDPNITILTSHEDMEEAELIAKPAVSYLRAYRYTQVEWVWTPLDIIDAMRDEYMEKADLVVVGLHRKKGLFDILDRSITKHVIEVATKPVFVST